MTIEIPNNQTTASGAVREASLRTLLDEHSLDADFQHGLCLDDFVVVDGGDIPL